MCAPPNAYVVRKCAGIYDINDELDAVIECISEMPSDKFEFDLVIFLAAGMCQYRDDVESCEVCVHEIVDFVHGSRIIPPIPPTDAELRNIFDSQNANFVLLRDMILSEKFLRGFGRDYILYELPAGGTERCGREGDVYRCGAQEGSGLTMEDVLSRAGIDQGRFDTYMHLLKEIGAYSVSCPNSRLYNSSPVSISMFRFGNVASGLSKRIEFFSPSSLANGALEYLTIVENTDGISDKTELYSVLRDGWFICCSQS